MADKTQKRKKKKHVIRRIIILLIVLALIAGAGFIGWSELKTGYTTTYSSYTASIGSISNALNFSGSLQLVDSAAYTAQSAATVRKIYVAEGDPVFKGEKLMRLSSGQNIEADFDGTVNVISVKEEDEVAAGAPLIQIADFTHMKVSIRVDEYDIGEVSVGEPCRVTTTATEKTFDSSISSINYISASNGNVAYYTATCYVDVSEGIYPGMQVTVSIPQSEAYNVVVLKAEALSFDEKNQAFVYVQNANGEMERSDVTVGVSNGNYVEIVSGVAENEVVYAVASTDRSASYMNQMMTSMFGTTQVQAPANQGGRWNRNGAPGSGNQGDGNWNPGNGMPSAPGRN